MEQLAVAMIGTGDPTTRGPTGYAMAYEHAAGYQAVPACQIVACADIVEEHAITFAQEFGVDPEFVYTNAETMMREVDPDIVSISTPIRTHAELVIGAARTGESLQAIHCEKPMAGTWGAAREMARVAEEYGIQLTFNHQRRFATPVERARELVEVGEIGELRRIEMGPINLLEYGTHSIDLANKFTGEADAEWVLANVDCREPVKWFDMYTENHGLATWPTADGVFCLAASGEGAGLVDSHHRLIGSEGTIELETAHETLRVRGRGDPEWRVVDTGGEDMHGPGYVERAIAEVVDGLRTGRPTELRVENALRATEIIFASYESARRRGRVDLPLQIEDNPLDDLLQAEPT